MKILVTSGGTSEAIDSVRSITNHSSGRLGKIITETLLKAGHEVCLITTPQAVKPAKHSNLTIIEIKNTAVLLQSMKDKIMDFQVLIHSMAVSDYTPVYMTGLDEVQSSQDLTELLYKKNQETKISSKEDVQVLFLKKNPKIISLVKEWNPSIHLIGFKLLVKNEENRTNTLISVYREGIIIKSIIDALEEKGYTVTGGKGKYAESLMRIGILGQISKEQIDDFFVIFEEELKKQL